MSKEIFDMVEQFTVRHNASGMICLITHLCMYKLKNTYSGIKTYNWDSLLLKRVGSNVRVWLNMKLVAAIYVAALCLCFVSGK